LGVYYINDSDRRGKMESGWGSTSAVAKAIENEKFEI
jgi:hypothetical protein